MEIVGSVLLRRIPRGTASLPSSIDAVVMTPAAWGEASAALTVPQATEPPADEAAGEDPALIEELTPRERDVLVLVAEGRANREIAEQLGISEHTVKFHLAALFGKLAVSTRTQAVRRALEWGLIAI